MEFDVAKRGHAPIPFWFSDKPEQQFQFEAPKSARQVFTLLDGDPTDPFLITRTNRDWLVNGLGPEQWKIIHERLLDPRDDLDWGTVDKVIDYLNEQVEGRPTT